jgi:hypothetical protein
MPCKWCEQLQCWECGFEPPDLCKGGTAPTAHGKSRGWKWTKVGRETLEEGKTYFLKCRPGSPCGAKVEETAGVTPPWEEVGAVSVPAKHLAAGAYDVYCGTGHGSKCRVRLHPAE